MARFCLVGAIGFAIDAVVLTTLVASGWHNYPARALSFGLAVSSTWIANRQWTFDRTEDARTEYTRYIAIQTIGALINLGIYVLIIEAAPRLAPVPVVPLAIGASIAMLFNFAATRHFVFGAHARLRGPSRGVPATSSYSGRENLEAMRHASLYNSFLRKLVLRHSPGGLVVDFGAGAGTFAIPLAEAGITVWCVEPDTDLRRQLEQAKLPSHASLDAIPRSSIDYIYSLNVLEHIEDDAGMVAALAGRLKPGGRLLLYVPAFEILYSSMDANVGHFRRYRKAKLRALVEAAGLRVERARYADSLGFFATLLFKWFGNDTGTLSPLGVKLYDRLAFPLSRLADRLLGSWIGKNLLIVAAKET